MAEVSVNSSDARAALPILVQLELAVECEKCKTAKAFLAETLRRAKGLHLTARTWDREGSWSERQERYCDLDSLELHCPDCKDSGLVPTDAGWRIVGLVKLFLEQASGRHIGQRPEVPF